MIAIQLKPRQKWHLVKAQDLANTDCGIHLVIDGKLVLYNLRMGLERAPWRTCRLCLKARANDVVRLPVVSWEVTG